jgi:hypothetical protein
VSCASNPGFSTSVNTPPHSKVLRLLLAGFIIKVTYTKCPILVLLATLGPYLSLCLSYDLPHSVSGFPSEQGTAEDY